MVDYRVASMHEGPRDGPAAIQGRAIAARVTEQEVTGNEAGSARARGGGSAAPRVVYSTGGIRSKTGRHSENVAFRQPGQHVAARGIHGRRQSADDGRLQQPRYL